MRNLLCWPPFSPQSIGSRSPTVVRTMKESVVQRPFSSGWARVNSSKSNRSWHTFGCFSMVTWQVSVPFSPRGYDGLTKTVSFWLVMPPHVNLKEQQAPKPLAHGPIDVPARRVHSASARQVPESPLSPLQAVFWNRTIDKIPVCRDV